MAWDKRRYRYVDEYTCVMCKKSFLHYSDFSQEEARRAGWQPTCSNLCASKLAEAKSRGGPLH